MDDAKGMQLHARTYEAQCKQQEAQHPNLHLLFVPRSGLLVQLIVWGRETWAGMRRSEVKSAGSESAAGGCHHANKVGDFCLNANELKLEQRWKVKVHTTS